MQQLLDDSTARAVLSAFVAALVVSAGLPGVVTAQAADPPRELDDCARIDEPGTYTLTRDVTNASADRCIAVRADGVTIDGDGHSIVGTGTGVAIAATGVDDLTVTNVTLTGWGTGVSISAGAASTSPPATPRMWRSQERTTITNSTITNSAMGVAAFADAGAVTVADNRIHNLTGAGVYLETDDGRVLANEIEATGGAAVVAIGGDEATVADNEIRATAGGVAVDDVGSATVRENALRDVEGTSIHVAGEREDWWANYGPDALYAVMIFSPSMVPGRTEIVGNTIHDGNGNGIVVENTSDVEIARNRLVRNRDGVRVAGASGVTVVDNNALANRDDGISFAVSPRGAIHNNTARNNGDDGFYVVGNDTTLTENVATGNGDDGIDAQNSSGVAVRGNTLTENANNGVFFRNVDHGQIEANEADSNDDDGIDLRGTDRVTVVNNSVCVNGDVDFISRTGTQNTTAENNHC